MFWIKFASKILKQEKKFSFLYIIILSLGLVGYIFIINLRFSTLIYLENNLKNILTADFSVNSRAPIDEEKIANIEKKFSIIQKAQKVNFFSMLQGKDIARIVQVQAISDTFPLYGSFQVNNQKVTKKQINQRLKEENKIWMSADTREVFGLRKDDEIKIGEQKFIVGEDITKAPLQLFSNQSLAPSVFISLNNFKKTRLLQTGSRISYRNYYKITDLKNNFINKILALKKEFKKDTQNTVYVRSYLDASDSLSRVIGYSTGFLSLISVTSLLLASIGITYSFRSHFYRSLRLIGILMSFGVKRIKISILFLLQLFFLGLISSALAIGFTASINSIASQIFVSYLPKDFSLEFTLQSVFFAILLGVFSSLIFALPVLSSLYKLRPSLLFQKIQLHSFASNKNIYYYLSYSTIIIFFFIISSLQIGLVNSFFFLLGIVIIVILIFYLWKVIFITFSKKIDDSLGK